MVADEKRLQKQREWRLRKIAEFGAEEWARIEREKRAIYRQKYPDRVREQARGKKKNLKAMICMAARRRARKKGLMATIRMADLEWPEVCPVLGLKLDYGTPRGSRTTAPNIPTLDRWDNGKGYEPGNVFVISYRANMLKGNGTAAELRAVANYAELGPAFSNPLATGSQK